MPLFVKNDVAVLYIHVPKTGGSSIEHFFEMNGFHCEFRDAGQSFSFNKYRHCSPQHMHAEQLRTAIRLTRVNYVFMTVRHPLSRLLSEFRTRVRDDRKPYRLARWVDQTFRSYIDDPFIIDNHIRPQAEYWIPGCEVFRQERGYDGLPARLEDRLGPLFPNRQIGQGNVGPEMAIPDAEIEQIRLAVRQFYRQDFLTFGYKAAPSAEPA